jgi:sugar phosphate isomerase/epimerase
VWHKRAVCNELFGKLDFTSSCALLQKHGFTGMEIAPFTISDERGTIGDATVARIKKDLVDHGLEFVGFHWLFSFPPGFETTSSDKAKQEEASAHLRHLLDVSGALGGGKLIFGSPKQRHVHDATPEEGLHRLEEFLAEIADHAQKCNSMICVEALPKKDTNVLNVLEQSQQMIKRIGKPSIQGMFDFHNCGDETLTWDRLVTTYFSIIRHIHLNDPEGNHPKPEDAYHYHNAFEALAKKRYAGWISLEIFSIPENPETVLEETSSFLDLMDHRRRAARKGL